MQLVAQARAVEDGLARAKVREGLGPAQERTAFLAHREAAQKLSQPVRTDPVPGLAGRLCKRPPVQHRTFVPGFADHPLPQGKLLLRGQQERERLAGTELGGLPLPLLPGGPWQNVGGGPGAPAGGLLLGVVGAPNGARQAPRGSDYGRAASQGGQRRGVHRGVGA